MKLSPTRVTHIGDAVCGAGVCCAECRHKSPMPVVAFRAVQPPDGGGRHFQTSSPRSHLGIDGASDRGRGCGGQRTNARTMCVDAGYARVMPLGCHHYPYQTKGTLDTAKALKPRDSFGREFGFKALMLSCGRLVASRLPLFSCVVVPS